MPVLVVAMGQHVFALLVGKRHGQMGGGGGKGTHGGGGCGGGDGHTGGGGGTGEGTLGGAHLPVAVVGPGKQHDAPLLVGDRHGHGAGGRAGHEPSNARALGQQVAPLRVGYGQLDGVTVHLPVAVVA